MATFNRCAFMFVAVTFVSALFAVQPSEAQPELRRFLDALDGARSQEVILFVYFYASDQDHPNSLLDVVTSEIWESTRERASHVDVDYASESGRELADAFFDYGSLLTNHQTTPILGIVPPRGRRAVTILSEDAGQIGSEDWSRLIAQIEPAQ
jgi:hypothetical protein